MLHIPTIDDLTQTVTGKNIRDESDQALSSFFSQ